MTIPTSPREARGLTNGQPVFANVTVILETEWVLHSAYDYHSAEIAPALRAIAGLPTVIVEDDAMVANALDSADKGMNFAVALHRAKAAHCEGIVSFDRKFIKAAKAAGHDSARKV